MKNLKLLYSLKFRLFLLLFAFGLLPGVLLWGSLLRIYENNAISAQSADILVQSKVLGTQLVAADYLNDPTSEILNAQLDLMSNLYDGRVLVVNSHFQIIRDTYGLDEGKTIISEEFIRASRGEETTKFDIRNRYIKITIPLRDNRVLEEDMFGAMIVSVSLDSIMGNYTYLRDTGLIIVMAVGILIVALAIFFSIRLTKPFRQISSSIDEIQTGEDEEGISVSDYMETESISLAFNALLKRLQMIEESRQEFVSNVSHELKTPLTSMKILADSLKDQENVPVELYQEFMADISAEIERENIIINDLLSLVKLDKATGMLNITSVSINDLLELILKRLRPIAEKKNIELVLESFRPVAAEIDEVKLTLALTNLIENAVKYNKDNGWVHVSLNADHRYFFVRVEDSGIGIPEDELEHIYERFFRVDKSHSREIGGTGLGLSITRSAILMHRGAIKAYSRLGEGTVFSVRIPLNFIA